MASTTDASRSRQLPSDFPLPAAADHLRQRHTDIPSIFDSDHRSTNSTITTTANEESPVFANNNSPSISPASSFGVTPSDLPRAKPSPLRRFSAWFLHNRNQQPSLNRSVTHSGYKDTSRQGKKARPLSTSTLASSAKSTAVANSTNNKKPQLDIDTTTSPIVVLEVPTPTRTDAPTGHEGNIPAHLIHQSSTVCEPFPDIIVPATSTAYAYSSHETIGAGETRRQSLIDASNDQIASALITSSNDPSRSYPAVQTETAPDAALSQQHLPSNSNMKNRKIWVKRPGGSATLVTIKEDDLVDDARDTILRKYANSLGKSIDAPDMLLRLAQRTDHNGLRPERLLNPEEEMCRTLDLSYPGGQTVEEALIVDVPQRKTPRPSPKVYHQQGHYHVAEDYRPLENDTGYFPPMPAFIPQSIPQTTGSHESRTSQHHAPLPLAPDHPPRSISVLNTGAIPPLPLPSPGARRRHPEHSRPKFIRNHTSSPNAVTHANSSVVAANSTMASVNHLPNRHRGDSSASETLLVPPIPGTVSGPLPTPPAHDNVSVKNGSTPPTPLTGVPTAQQQQQQQQVPPGQALRRPRRGHRKSTPDRPSGRAHHKHSNSIASNTGIAISMLDGSVPPINVLIVEDNVINLRVLEGLMKRLKVRWQTAVNGQIGVDKWKAGGFHLVLMDIQMPVMNGLQATKEIRRLERVNGIGVFSSTGDEPASEPANGETESEEDKERKAEKDKLNLSEGLFKSPIIIVALTASSLQSDRHEALAAGCNDFLTKPVDFVWLERKVKEWGCMQALIDFDGWRKWKDYASKEEASKAEQEQVKALARQEKKAKEKQRAKTEDDERKKQEAEAAATAPEKAFRDKTGAKTEEMNIGTAPNPVVQSNPESSESNGINK